MKATNLKVTTPFLKLRMGDGRFGKSKWIEFCELQLAKGRVVYLTEAKDTVSKYITVDDQFGQRCKVRFSNHKPIKRREANGDCDFFVGVCNFVTTTMEDAVAFVEDKFNARERNREAERSLREAAGCEGQEESVRGASGQMVLFPEGLPIHRRVQSPQ